MFAGVGKLWCGRCSDVPVVRAWHRKPFFFLWAMAESLLTHLFKRTKWRDKKEKETSWLRKWLKEQSKLRRMITVIQAEYQSFRFKDLLSFSPSIFDLRSRSFQIPQQINLNSLSQKRHTHFNYDTSCLRHCNSIFGSIF